MKIILLQKTKNLGNIGDIIIVKSGYARNFLFPKGYALESTKENILYINKKKKKIYLKEQKKIKEFKKILKKIKKLKLIKIFSRVGPSGKLFGSISFKDIFKKILDFGINVKIKKNQFYFPNGPLKKSGIHKIYYNPHKTINFKIHVNILPKK